MIKVLKDTYYNGTSYKYGAEYELSPQIEKRWIKNGIAEAVETPTNGNKYADMTDEELSEYAAMKGVDISKAKTREAVIAKLEKAEMEKEN